jgi:hypothetical protein
MQSNETMSNATAIRLQAALNLGLPTMAIWVVSPWLRAWWDLPMANGGITVALRAGVILLALVLAYCAIRLAAVLTRWIWSDATHGY